jgi:hypothetical protein
MTDGSINPVRRGGRRFGSSSCMVAGAFALMVLHAALPSLGEAQVRVAPVSVNRALAVSGAVFDKAGRPLSGVTVGVLEVRDRPSPIPGDVVYFSRSLVAHDGLFDVACEAPCLNLELQFRKDGYFPAALDVNQVEVIWGLGTGQERRVPLRQAAKATNTLVTLERMTEPVAVDTMEVHPEADARESGKVGVLDLERGRGRSVTPAGAERMVAKKGSAGAVALVRLALAPEAGGSPIAKRMRESGTEAELPAPVVLTLGEGNGFVRYEPQSRKLDSIYRDMRRAPESGYGDLALTGESGEVFFYCKVGDRYGKGRVTPIMLSRRGDDDPQVEVGVEIRLNRGGTRSVESAK